MQAVIDGHVRELTLPHAEEMVLPGIAWGAFDELLTPAYWRGQAWQHQNLGSYANTRLGRTLTEELTACLLGGYGMPAELGLAAFARLRDSGLLTTTTTSSEIEEALSTPFTIGEHHRHYRFPRQKARYISKCLAQIGMLECEPTDDVALRGWLTRLPGIGPKTASWIVRNYRASNAVAIIDIHILRAGRYMGLFEADADPQREYFDLEASFLAFAAAIEVPAAFLDALMWDYMRRLSQSLVRTVTSQQIELSFAQPKDRRAYG